MSERRKQNPTARGRADRIPPHNLEAEMALLGAILVDREMYEVARTHVRPEDFYAHVHGDIFAAMAALLDGGKPCDKIALAEELRRRSKLDAIGGLSYLSELMDTVQTTESVEYYAKIVAEKFGLRRLIEAGLHTAREAYEGEEVGPTEVASLAIARIESIVERGAVRTAIEPRRAAYDLAVHIENGGDKVHPTPWPELNERIGGFARREMNIWGANPGMGKTAAGMCLAHHRAVTLGPTGYFCLEMGVGPTVKRFGAMFGEVSITKIRQNTLSRFEFQRIIDGMDRYFSDYPLVLFDKRPAWSIADIALAARKMRREHGDLAALFIDHVGFVTDVTRADGGESKHHRLDAAFKHLLALADELNCEMHVIQHMNRAAKDGVPTMFDLRDGGNPEGNAHNIIIPWRPNPQDDDPEERSKGVFVVDKARDGEVGAAKMRFRGQHSLWVSESDPTPWWKKLDDEPPALPGAAGYD